MAQSQEKEAFLKLLSNASLNYGLFAYYANSYILPTSFSEPPALHRALHSAVSTDVCFWLLMACLPCLPLPTDPEGARTSSSLSSSFDCVTSGSGATFLTSCSCSTLLRNAKIRWCSAAYSCPVSLELAWGFQYSATRKEMQGITTD